jgi:hypothetical protein
MSPATRDALIPAAGFLVGLALLTAGLIGIHRARRRATR